MVVELKYKVVNNGNTSKYKNLKITSKYKNLKIVLKYSTSVNILIYFPLLSLD